MRALSPTTGRIGLSASGVGLTPYSAAPGRTRSNWNCGPRNMPAEFVGVAGILEESVQHIDRCRRRHRRAHDTRLVEGCDKERLAAGVGKRARDLLGPAAIGIGLDHAGAFGGNSGLFQLAPVRDDGVE